MMRFFIDSEGTLWVPANGILYRRAMGRPDFVATPIAVDLLFGVAEASDGSLWVSDVLSDVDRGRTQHVDRSGSLIATLQDEESAQDTLRATDGSLWMASQVRGLRRYEPSFLSSAGAAGSDAPETYTYVDGLSSNQTRTLFRDVEGNVWVGGSRGLDRFSQATLKPFARKTESVSSICASETTGVWVTAAAENRLFRVTDGAIKTLSTSEGFYSAACGRKNVWLIAPSGMWQEHDDKIERTPLIPGAGPYLLRWAAEAKTDRLYTSIGTDYWVYADGEWRRAQPESGTKFPPLVGYVDSQNQLWTGDRTGLIHRPFVGKGQEFSSGSPGIGVVFAFLESKRGMFVAGMNGLAVRRDSQFQLLRFAEPASAHGVTGLVESANGDLWMNAARGIARVPLNELERWLSDPAYLIKTESVREGNFVGPASLGLWPSAARDPAGNLWFSTYNGVVTISPDELAAAPRPPIMSIRSFVVDDRAVPASGKIPPYPQTVNIKYLGVHLIAPDAVAYRYRLDGFDDAWQDVGHRTEAIYTQLRPGRYTFQVMASSGHGVWSAPIATMPFVVLPGFYQTAWFAVLCLSALGFCIWILFRLRLRQVARTIRRRSEDRADERIRIARELHDTLLQAVHGLMMQFHAVAQTAAPDDRSRAALERALESADNVIIEGRDRVSRLRTEPLTDVQLAQALQNIAGELGIGAETSYQVRRNGTDATLQPHVADELFAIGREAVRNAVRHSAATAIVVELSYQKRQFTLCCRDNGCGFTAQPKDEAARRGHWGLRGMQERIEKLGGRLVIRSDPSNFTEILASLPGHRAYTRRSFRARSPKLGLP